MLKHQIQDCCHFDKHITFSDTHEFLQQRWTGKQLFCDSSTDKRRWTKCLCIFTCVPYICNWFVAGYTKSLLGCPCYPKHVFYFLFTYRLFSSCFCKWKQNSYLNSYIKTANISTGFVKMPSVFVLPLSFLTRN